MAHSYARLSNPPKSTRITKALLRECLWVMNQIDYWLFLSRKLEAPALGIPDEWRMEVQERMTACLAHLNTWRDNERKKAKKRLKEREVLRGAVASRAEAIPMKEKDYDAEQRV